MLVKGGKLPSSRTGLQVVAVLHDGKVLQGGSCDRRLCCLASRRRWVPRVCDHSMRCRPQRRHIKIQIKMEAGWARAWGAEP